MNFSNWQRTITHSIAIVMLGAGAAAAQASDRNAQYLAACQSELKLQYGQDMDVSVVNKRRSMDGVEVKLAARTDDNNVDFVNCWVPRNDTAHPFDTGANTMAVVIEPVEVIE
ncbi:MAG: hypothetical protein AAGF35_15180 [Pseudomonadota bacterium]